MSTSPSNAVEIEGIVKIGMPADSGSENAKCEKEGSLKMSTSPTNAVEIERIVKRFGATTAVDDVSLEIAPGELFGFIGPDGAGKTTLFRILVTLLLPDAGRATVLGRDVTKEIWDLRRRVGY